MRVDVLIDASVALTDHPIRALYPPKMVMVGWVVGTTHIKNSLGRHAWVDAHYPREISG